MAIRQCEICKKTYRVKRRTQRFCSKSCAGKVRFGENSTTFIDGITTQGYRSVFVDGKRMLEHRHVMGQHLGRKLKPTEIVHHKDENKLNNAIGNLEIVTRKSHKELHNPAGLRTETHKECRKCGRIKPRADFYRKNAPGRDSHRPRCKTCDK